ncbi:hypothetical protein [Streptomyces sp. NPDC059063]|uniref:hypothetical protein n=1 Tax=unclassified Streptomyces TaxID=2593676 RepID=UPI00369F2D8E
MTEERVTRERVTEECVTDERMPGIERLPHRPANARRPHAAWVRGWTQDLIRT